MGIIYGGTFPVLPGKEERIRNFANELAPHQAEWDRLCEEGTFSMVAILLQETPNGMIATYVNEVEDMDGRRTSFGDSPYDRWWLEFAKDVYGIDLANLPPRRKPPSETVFQWNGA